MSIIEKPQPTHLYNFILKLAQKVVLTNSQGAVKSCLNKFPKEVYLLFLKCF